MNQLFSSLKRLRLHQLIAVVFAAIAFLVIPTFTYNAAPAQADTLFTQADPYEVDSATIKRIQEKAEDLGDSPERPIGDTGLKNIKKLGENIPETLDLNRRQGFFSGDPNDLDTEDVIDKAQEKVGGAVESTKRAIKDATS